MKKLDREEEKSKEEVRHAWGISFLRFGIIGFIIITPALMGAIIGMFLDAAIPGTLPWNVVLIVLGVACGFFLSWSWLINDIRRGKQAG